MNDRPDVGDVRTSETSVSFKETTRRYIQESCLQTPPSEPEISHETSTFLKTRWKSVVDKHSAFIHNESFAAYDGV
jgi:hypothetical protein